jgi:hypothetical protein
MLRRLPQVRGVLALTAIASVLATVARAAAAEPPTAKLVSVRKIWDKAPHNAFTDLAYLNNRWYCVFREGAGHVSPDGSLRVLASADGVQWESLALIKSENSDLRDPKLCITPDKRLMLTAAEAIGGGGGKRHQSLVWFSDDGKSWGERTGIGDPDFWLWRMTWHEDKAYAVGYGCRPDDQIVRLYQSGDGKTFSVLKSKLQDEGQPNEASLLFLEDDTCICLLRRDGNPSGALLGTSTKPYTQWEWKDLGKRVGGPAIIRLPSGEFVAAVRLYDGQARTALCWLDPDAGRLTEFLKLPSGGDTSYAGLVWCEQHLWVSYYSSHEGKANIYLAKVAIE